MSGGTHTAEWRQRILGLLGLVVLAQPSCVTEPRTPVVQQAARPHADEIRAEAPRLLPEQPVVSTTASRGQQGDVVPAAGTGTQVAARIRAKVNDIPILEDELREAMAQFAGELLAVPEAQRGELLQKIADRELQKLIDRELVLEDMVVTLKQLKLEKELQNLKEAGEKEADKRLRDIKQSLKVTTDEEMKAILQNQGLSVAGVRRQVERNFVMMEYVRNKIHPIVNRISLQELREYYHDHGDEFKVEDKVRWQDIFIDASRFRDLTSARQYVDQLLARAKAGEDVAKLSMEYDHGDSKLRNGDGLGGKQGEIKPAEVEGTILSLRPGEVALVELRFGYHIVKVVQREYAGRRPFDAACQADVRRKLQNIMAEREYKRIVDELKKKATIQIYQESGDRSQ
jgi:parvulin-like peptidyl-prolyl isomerase